MGENMSAGDYLNSGVFSVTMGNLDLSFSKISGIGQTTEYDTYVEGGGRMHLLPKPRSSAGTITLERGVTVIERRMAGILFSGGEIHNIIIHLQKNGMNAESYFIESGMVVSWELDELNAINPGVLVKKITVAHTGLRILS